MSHEEKRQGIADAALARAELYDTLSQLKVRLNYAQRVDDALDEAKLRIAQEKRTNPLRFAAGVAGAATLVGLTVWGIAASVSQRFR
ncbi:hypothetical protein ACFWHR_15280 [Leucobacter sp. NPDC058333]|uniref:hypothetical protein n=1 Tax=Leucobacter sp. NPDC058333 TaxID=3346450 RepID=UPI00364AF2D0